MEKKNFGNNYDLNATWRFLKRWKTLLIIVTVAAFAVSLTASLLVTPRYKATAILFPTSSNRLSKAILADRYSMDFMDYGIERDCEYAIQILSSKSMEDAVCQRFNMMEHYGISPDEAHCYHKMHNMYRSNVSVRRTDYLGVEINVLDVDPQWAADMANFIAANYDTLSSQIQRDRAQNSYDIMEGVCNEIQQDLFAYEEQLRNEPQHALALRELINRKCKELAKLQSRMSETKVDLNQQVSYKFWLDQACKADNKAYPKRTVIVLLGTLSALLVCILSLLVVGRIKGDDPDDENRKNRSRGKADRDKNNNGKGEQKNDKSSSSGNTNNEGERQRKHPSRKDRNSDNKGDRNSDSNADRKDNRKSDRKDNDRKDKNDNRVNDRGNDTHKEELTAVANTNDNRPKTDIAPNPPSPRIPRAPYNDAPSF